MKKVCVFALVAVLVVLAVVPAFAGVRCHLPGCDGHGGTLCSVRYMNERLLWTYDEPGYDYENGHSCIYRCYVIERDVYAVCNKNSSHTLTYHERVVSRSVYCWTD